jgi:hypothetical protein
MRRTGGHRILLSIIILAWPVLASAEFTVTFGSSWDDVPLQQILDEEYGFGVIDAATDYEGYLSGDGDPAYWVDTSLDGLMIREIAGHRHNNTLGWYAEDLSGPPVIDGVDDGVIFDGPSGPGNTTTVFFPDGMTQFGIYLNPNGAGDGGGNAPEPEIFFANRFYNDIGPDGTGALHEPRDGDPQVLIYNITHLNGGTPTYVLAWEDLDYGSPVSPTGNWYFTDNDFQDLVVEIQAVSPVPTETSTWGDLKALYR